MSAQPWGRTGRVTLEPSFWRIQHRVRVDGVRLGSVFDHDEQWSAVITRAERHLGYDFPTRDHAVMAVLRRAAPDVWRAERPVVWRVSWQERNRGWCAEGPKTYGVFPGYSRGYYRSNDEDRTHPWRRALTDARFYARAEHAARSTR